VVGGEWGGGGGGLVVVGQDGGLYLYGLVRGRGAAFSPWKAYQQHEHAMYCRWCGGSKYNRPLSLDLVAVFKCTPCKSVYIYRLLQCTSTLPLAARSQQDECRRGV
jgi:hypothetical protein